MDDKERDLKVVIKSSFWYTVSNFLTRAMVFITTPIFTRLMTTEQYGDFNVFANWQSIFLIICGLEIYATVNRARFDFTDEKSLNGYVTSSLVLSTVATGVTFALYLFIPGVFENILLMDRHYIFIMFAYLFTYPAFEMFQACQRINYNYKINAIISFCSVIICSLSALFLVNILEKERLLGRIIGQYMPMVFLGLFFYYKAVSKSHEIKIRYWKYAIKIAIPLVFSYLAGQILLSADKIIVQHLCSAEAVAYLGIATSCAHIILIFVQCLNNAWAPWFYDKLDKKKNRQIQDAFRLYLWFVIFCTFGSLMIGPELVYTLGGAKYAAAKYLLPANMLSGVFNLLILQFGSLETFYMKPHYAAVMTGITAVVNLVLDYIFVNKFGYLAASYVTVGCYLLLILMHYSVLMKLRLNNIFLLKDIGLVIFITLLMIPVSLLSYQNSLIRWGIIGILAIIFIVMLLVKKKMVIGFINQMRKI